MNAIPYPSESIIQVDDGVSYLYRTYTLPDGYHVYDLMEPPFDRDGYRYRFREIIPGERTAESETKPVREQVSLEAESGDIDKAIALFEPTIPYNDDEGYEGELSLIPESVTIAEAGSTPYSFTVSEEREYWDLDQPDPALLPQSVVKDGTRLTLSVVQWSVGEYGPDGSANYNCTATYSTRITGVNVTGYTVTAIYSGDAVKELPVFCTYSIVYEGEPLEEEEPAAPLLVSEEPPPPSPPEFSTDDPPVVKNNPVPAILKKAMPWVLAALAVAGCVTLVRRLHRTMTNVSVTVTRDGKPDRTMRRRINLRKQTLKLRGVKNGATITIDEPLKRELEEYGGTFHVIGRYQSYEYSAKSSRKFSFPPQTPPGSEDGRENGWKGGGGLE